MMYDVKKCTSLALAIMLLGATSGCADRVSVAEAEMQKIRELRANPIEPPPTPKVIEDYDYAANGVRSPFVPQSLLDLQSKIANTPSVRPDENRIKHELEEFELSELIYRGKVIAPNGQEYALVQARDGVVRNVQVGDYMGKNHGRIVEITPTQINLIEIVEDTKLGYVEKSANLIPPNEGAHEMYFEDEIMTSLIKKADFVYSALAVSMLAVEAHALAIQSLSANQASDNSTQLRISFDGTPIKPVVSQQAGSNQMIFDFNRVSSSGLPRDMPINRGVVNSVTALNSGSSTRLLVNLNGTAKYTSSVEGNQLVLKLAQDNNTRAVQPATSQAMNVRVNPLLSQNVGSLSTNSDGISAINYSGNKTSGGNVRITLVNEAIPVDVQRQGNKLVIRTTGATIPRHLVRQTQAGGLVSGISATNQGQSGVVTINMTGDFEYQAYQSGASLNISIAPPKKLRDPSMEEKVYKGEPLSMEFQDVSVRTVLDVLGQFTNTNIVASDSVQGNITLRLVNVPWDQALDIILKSKNLGMRKNGNVILVAPAQELNDAETKALEESRKVNDLLPLRTEYIRLNYAKVDDVLALLDKADSPGSSGTGRGSDTSLLASSRGIITSDPRTNTIIIKDTSEGIESIRTMIEKIDIPVKQIMIEARIVTATENFSKEIGVRWGSTQNSTRTAFNPLKPTATLDSASLSVNLGGTTSAATSAFSIGLLSISDMLLDLTLQAMQAERRGEVISSPKVLTADKQTAKISSGKQIPYQEASASGATSTSFQEAALSLEATPNVTPDGKISINLKIENADTTGEVYGGVPVIRKDAVNTNVLLEDGQTVVLGGVFRNTVSTGKSKVPFLGDVPGVGRLFKYDSKENNKEELLIFITPKLVNDGVSRFN